MLNNKTFNYNLHVDKIPKFKILKLKSYLNFKCKICYFVPQKI